MTKLHSRDIMFRIHGHPLWAHPPNGQKNLDRSVSHICGCSKGSKAQDWNPPVETDSPIHWLRPDSPRAHGRTGPVHRDQMAQLNEPVDASQAAVG
jgi:hypothetical protein